MKTVGVRELKNNLSAYLREVRRGVRVLVSDRNRVVAELREPQVDYEVGRRIDPRLAALIESGTVVPPSAAKGKLPSSPVRLERGTAKRLLDAEREE